MQWKDIAKESFGALTVNKTRSLLTMLGIVIGIGSVIGMVALGQGAQSTIQANIQSIGSNLLIVRPGSQQGPGSPLRGGVGSATTLTLDDAEAIKEQVQGITGVAPEVSSRQQVTARGTNTNTSITGITEAYGAVRNIAVAEGVFISSQHLSRAAKVAILGPTVRTDLFGEGVDVLGQKVRINKTDYTVIGVTVAKGGGGFGSSDDAIYIPLTTAQRYLTGNDKVSVINVAAEDADTMSAIQTEITTVLLDTHRISDPAAADFSVFNQADIVATASSITQTFTILLGAVAGISLIVGGIGIMNMMLTSVTERTREIGLRKAIGARNRDISRQFLLEAVMLTLVGGILGILLGWGIALLANKLANIAASVSLFSIFLAVSVSTIIGIVFGYYPARKAAHLNPIDALRYE
ncbi:MAG: ABC transporter permease [Candidatus Pacebacteria bacterium]|nr:ABC transporter permease [Candidatus Paceibacterota bacterium]